MKIQVTQEDIDKGEKGNSTCCPIALACLRVLGKNWSEVYWKLDKSFYDHFPQGVRRFILKFDSNQQVFPFEFELPEEMFVAQNTV